MMVVPTIHLNGTGGKELFAQVCVANRRARQLVDALIEMTPNGRDYYPQGADALKQAKLDHDKRVDAVVRVRDELIKLADAIADAVEL